MESSPTMLVALDSGKVDLVVTDMPTAMAAVKVYPDMKLLDFANSENDKFNVSEEEINIGISLLKGAGTTLAIALVGTFIDCVIGFIVGLSKQFLLIKR